MSKPYTALSDHRYPICIVYSPNDEGYIAWLPDFGCSACSAFGETPEEAIEELRASAEGVIGYYEDEGYDLPTPTIWENAGSGPPPLLDEAWKQNALGGVPDASQ